MIRTKQKNKGIKKLHQVMQVHLHLKYCHNLKMSELDMKTTGNIRPIITDFAADINKAKIRTNESTSIQFRDDLDNNKERPVYKVSTEYLHFRKDNGRIASDVLTYESSKGELNEAT